MTQLNLFVNSMPRDLAEFVFFLIVGFTAGTLGIVQFQKNNLYNFIIKNRIFIKFFKIQSLTDACYELKSYERGVAQLGSAGALGVTDYTNQKYCNNWIKLKYYS